MKKNILSLQVFLLVTFTSFCQEINLTWGPEKEAQKSNIELGYVGRVKDHFYTLRKQEKVMYLAKTRIKDMSLVFDKPIQWNEGRKNTDDSNLSFKSFRLFKDHFLFYFEDYSSKDDQERLYAQKINFDGVAVDVLQELGARKKERRSKDGSFDLVYSADSSNFLLVTNPAYDKYSNEKFYFTVFNSKLKSLHSLETTLPFADKNFKVESITLSKSKVIHILAMITLPKKERKEDEAAYYYEVISIDPNEKGKAKEFEVKLDKRYVDDVDLILDDKDNLKCFGFYADMDDNGRRRGGINGVFYFAVVNGKPSNISMKQFDSKFVEEIAGKRRANKNKGIGSYFALKNFFNKPDGGAMVVAEEAFVEVVSSRNGTTYYYHYNSIVAVNIDPKGNIIWYAHVPKKQMIVNDSRFGSFYAMYVKGKLYLIYNDHVKNAVMKNYDYSMTNYLKSAPVVVTLNAEGKSDKKPIGDPAAKKDFTLKPNASDRISHREAFFYADRLSKSCCVIGARKTKTQRFGILTIQ